jgi:hypothetical protein
MLKTLITLPAVGLVPGAITGCSDGPCVNILLHGLFMMEFQDENKLVIATPKFDGHEFKMRRHGQPPNGAPDLPELISLEGLVTAGKRKTFAPENLQFPAADLGGGYRIDYQNPSKHNHRCTMVLPLPNNIIGLRSDDKKNFHPYDSSIGQHICSNAKTNLATITCIQYEPAPGKTPFVINYYAEHKNITVESVNAALAAARDVCGSGFNLKMKALGGRTVPDTTFPEGVDQSDEEPLHQEKNVDIASCPQFGITGS